MAHIQPRRAGDDHEVIDVAHQDIERHLAVKGIRVSEHADSGYANARTHGNLAHGAEWGRACCARMANDGGKQVAVGIEHVFVLGGLPNLGHDLALDGNQIEDVAVAVVAALS